MKRAIIFSDLHAWCYREHSKIVGGMNSRFLNALYVLDQIKRIAEKYQCDAVIFLGDLFSGRGLVEFDLVSEMLPYLIHAFDRIKLPKILVSGNHDLGQSGHTSILYALAKETCQVVSGSPLIKRLKSGIRLIFLDASSSSPEILNQWSLDKDSILFLHTGFNDIPYRGVLLKQEKLKRSDIPADCLAFLGHIHHWQRLGNAYYLGACQHIDRNDFGRDNWCLILDVETLKLKWIKLKGSRYIKISVDEVSHYSEVKNNFIYVVMDDRAKKQEVDIQHLLLERGAFDVTFIYPPKIPLTYDSIESRQVLKIEPREILRLAINQCSEPLASFDTLFETCLGIYGRTL